MVEVILEVMELQFSTDMVEVEQLMSDYQMVSGHLSFH